MRLEAGNLETSSETDKLLADALRQDSAQLSQAGLLLIRALRGAVNSLVAAIQAMKACTMGGSCRSAIGPANVG